MKKHVLRWLAALAVLLPCLLLSAAATERTVTASGYCGGEKNGTNLTWTLYEDGELIISGSGAMADYSFNSDRPWHTYRSQIIEVTIDNGATSIGVNTFSDCASLTTVTIGGGVTSVGEGAFSWCNSLTAFAVSEGSAAYSSVDGVLFNEDGTTLVYYPAGKAGSYTIPSRVTSIGKQAFASCRRLTGITIGSGVTSIGAYAFQSCTNLANMVIPDSVTTIGEWAFYDCESLTSVIIPDGVTTIGYGAFVSCNSLTEIIVTANNTFYSSQDGVLFNKEKTLLIQCPYKKSGVYVIPNGVNTIGDYAFNNCVSLTGLTIPSSVTNIGKYGVSWCDCLAKVEFMGNAPTLAESSSFYLFSDPTVYYHEGTTGWPTTGTWQGYPLVMIPSEDGDEQDDTCFEVDEYKATGTAPTQTDKVFAGWYTDNTFGQAHTAATGSAHAKFVNKDVFRVKAQITANTTADSEFADLRFVTTVDSLNYKKVGFKITFGGKTVTEETSTVYSSIVSNTDGMAFDYKPSVFHEDSKYFMTYVLTDIPNANFDDTFTVTPYWVTLDGTVVEGVTNELRVSMGY